MTLEKRLFIVFIAIVCCFSAIFPFAHNAYTLKIGLDTAGLAYTGSVPANPEGHEESRKEPVYGSFSGWTNRYDQYKAALTAPKRKEALYDFYHSTLGLKKATSPSAMAFVFPGYHYPELISIGPDGHQLKVPDPLADENTNIVDKMRAERIKDTVVKDLNACLQFIVSKCYTNSMTTVDFQLLAVDVAIRSEQRWKQQEPDDMKIGDVVVKFEAPTQITTDEWGLRARDYIKVTIGGDSREFCFNCPKGYLIDPYEHGWNMQNIPKDHEYYEDFLEDKSLIDADKGDRYLGRAKNNNEVAFINWSLVILKGNYRYDVLEKDVNDMVEEGEPSWFIKLIGDFFKWAIDSITSALQLKSIDQFMLIRGACEQNWVYGIFPSVWLRPGLILYATCLIIALSLIGFSLLKILWKRQLSTINIGEKIAMQEDLKNLIVTLFLFFAFIPIFVFLAGLNYTLVEMFETTIGSDTLTMPAISYTNFGQIVLGIADLVLKIYFNVFYIVRGATVVVLIGVAPLAIYSISLGGKFTGVFSAYFKELISQIFVQSIHAVMSAFFFNTLATIVLSPFEKMALLYAFLPITKFVKTKIFQLSEGPASQVGLNGVKTATGFASGVAKGATSFNPGKSSGSNSENGRGHGGGSSGGDGILSSAIDRNATTAKKPTGSRLDMTDSHGHENENTKEKPYGGAYRKDRPAPNYIRDADRVAADRLEAGIGRMALTGAKSGLYAGSALLNAGMAVGMGMLGEDPSKFAEQAGANLGKAAQTKGLAVKQGYDAVSEYDKYRFGRNSQRHQYITEAENAGIIGIRKTGGAMTYAIDSRHANDHHRSLYDDLQEAYTKPNDKAFTAQQLAAQKHYRDNYGITDVRSDGVLNKRLQVDLDTAAMEAHRMSDTNPFAGMKTFNWAKGGKPSEQNDDDDI